MSKFQRSVETGATWRRQNGHWVKYEVPETVTVTYTREEALALSSCIDGALLRLRSTSAHAMLPEDIAVLQRASYAVLGMPIPDWLKDEEETEEEEDEGASSVASGQL